jgi:hypothetical protein
MLKALADVVSTAGKNMGEGPRTSLLGLVEANLNEAEGRFPTLYIGACVGFLKGHR